MLFAGIVLVTHGLDQGEDQIPLLDGQFVKANLPWRTNRLDAFGLDIERGPHSHSSLAGEARRALAFLGLFGVRSSATDWSLLLALRCLGPDRHAHRALPQRDGLSWCDDHIACRGFARHRLLVATPQNAPHGRYDSTDLTSDPGAALWYSRSGRGCQLPGATWARKRPAPRGTGLSHC